MARVIEFIGNHWILSALWICFLVALILYQKAKAGKTVSPHQTTLLINRSNGVVLDIRDKKEFDKGHIVDAINIPLAGLKGRITELAKHKDKPVIVVCQLGPQSAEASRLLHHDGFTMVNRLAGGMTEWRNQGLPVVTN